MVINHQLVAVTQNECLFNTRTVESDINENVSGFTHLTS